MNGIVQLHYKIQRRNSQNEFRMLVFGSILCLSFFLFTNLFLHSRLLEEEETRLYPVVLLDDDDDNPQQQQQQEEIRHNRRTRGHHRREEKEEQHGEQQQQRNKNNRNRRTGRRRRKNTNNRYRHDPPIVTQEQLDIYYNALQEKRQPDPDIIIIDDGSSSLDDYDIWNCPRDLPPTNYPRHFSVMDVLEHWNPDINTKIPNSIYQSLCIFDYFEDKNDHSNNENDEQRQRQQQQSQSSVIDDTIRIYQQSEVPFIVRNHPDILPVAYRWQDDMYLQKLLLSTNNKDNDNKPKQKPNNNDNEPPPQPPKFRTEKCPTNHCMFWRLRNKRQEEQYTKEHPDWTPPTENIELSFVEWFQLAQAMEEENDNVEDPEKSTSTNNQTHYYFRLNASPGNNDFLYDELPFFQPTTTKSSSLFMIEPKEHRGINCRFGMKGILAEAHYDTSRNWIIVLKGTRRYILSNPNQCQYMELYDMDHPSARHSKINWSSIAKSRHNYTGPFAKAQVLEVVLQAGDALYLPTSWFHFIQNINLNYQCNARSGITYEHLHDIEQCGFPSYRKK